MNNKLITPSVYRELVNSFWIVAIMNYILNHWRETFFVNHKKEERIPLKPPFTDRYYKRKFFNFSSFFLLHYKKILHNLANHWYYYVYKAIAWGRI